MTYRSPRGNEEEGRRRPCLRPRGARARLWFDLAHHTSKYPELVEGRTSDYKQHDSWHKPIGRSRERASRGSFRGNPG